MASPRSHCRPKLCPGLFRRLYRGWDTARHAVFVKVLSNVPPWPTPCTVIVLWYCHPVLGSREAQLLDPTCASTTWLFCNSSSLSCKRRSKSSKSFNYLIQGSVGHDDSIYLVWGATFHKCRYPDFCDRKLDVPTRHP